MDALTEASADADVDTLPRVGFAWPLPSTPELALRSGAAPLLLVVLLGWLAGWALLLMPEAALPVTLVAVLAPPLGDTALRSAPLPSTAAPGAVATVAFPAVVAVVLAVVAAFAP